MITNDNGFGGKEKKVGAKKKGRAGITGGAMAF
jgi:hypothetical protein